MSSEFKKLLAIVEEEVKNGLGELRLTTSDLDNVAAVRKDLMAYVIDLISAHIAKASENEIQAIEYGMNSCLAALLHYSSYKQLEAQEKARAISAAIGKAVVSVVKGLI